MKNNKKTSRKCRGKGQGTLERKPNGVYLARWMVNKRKFSRSTGTTDKDEAERLLALFVKPFQHKRKRELIENVVAELEKEIKELRSKELHDYAHKEGSDDKKKKNKTKKNKNNKKNDETDVVVKDETDVNVEVVKKMEEENMANISYGDSKKVMLNKCITWGSCLMAAWILLAKNLFLLFMNYSAFIILFPMAYVFMKFAFSDCINKSYVIDNWSSEYCTMCFRDSSKNVSARKFIARETLNANFWVVLASFAVSFFGLFWKMS